MLSINTPFKVARRAARRALTSRFASRVIGVQLMPFNRANEFCRGRGIEIGALSKPFPFTHASVRYADVATANNMKNILAGIPINNLYQGELTEPDIILLPPKYDLNKISNSELDFVYSSHSLEHTPNTIFAISDSLRVIRPGGYVYMIIPNKEETYDVKRKTTPVAKLIEKYERNIFDYTIEEAIDVVRNTVDHPLYQNKNSEFAHEILRENSGIHHFHTFDPASTVGILAYCQEKFECRVVYFCIESNSIHFCLQKH